MHVRVLSLHFFCLFQHGHSQGGLEAELIIVKREKDSFLLQVGTLSDQLENKERELNSIRQQLDGEKSKNSELSAKLSERMSLAATKEKVSIVCVVIRVFYVLFKILSG